MQKVVLLRPVVLALQFPVWMGFPQQQEVLVMVLLLMVEIRFCLVMFAHLAELVQLSL